MTPRRRVNYLIPAVTVLISAFAASAHAQTVDELQRQLEAQQEINAQLRQRVLTLEETIESLQERNEASAEEIEVTPDAVSSTVAVTPADEMLDVSDLGALEQALVQRGSSVLPPYSAQVVPVTSWSHSGSSALGSERNSYDVGLAARMGLPRGMMAGVSVPYVVNSEISNSENSGIGDISLSIWKQIVARNRTRPSLLARFTYVVPTGEDPFETSIPLGSGFHVLQGTLSTVKSVAPVAFYGDLSYSYPISRMIEGQKLAPGDTIGIGLGSTLAATPEIALSLDMNFAFVGKFEVDGITIDSTDRTIGTVGLGAGFLLSQRMYLSISGQFGVTDDASDLGVSVALPMRF